MKETAICFYEDEQKAYFSSSERKHITRIMKLEEQAPGSIRIIKTPEQNYGMLYCEIPKEWMFLRIPKKMNYSEEQKAEMAERMRVLNSPNTVREIEPEN